MSNAKVPVEQEATREPTRAEIAEALHAAVAAIYFADSSDFRSALWAVVTALGGEAMAERLEENGGAVYDTTEAAAAALRTGGEQP